MRALALVCITAIGAACGSVGTAGADVKLVVRTKEYDVKGATGAVLVEAMDRLGPKHGYMTRAIAETGYTVHWDLDIARQGGVCHLRQANGTLDLTYTFPRRTSPASPGLRKRWDRFMAGVRRHEHTHGRIATGMMRATETALAGLQRPDNWFCTGTHLEARRRINAIYAEYEARQNAFDVREHRGGGHVEHLVDALTKP